MRTPALIKIGSGSSSLAMRRRFVCIAFFTAITFGVFFNVRAGNSTLFGAVNSLSASSRASETNEDATESVASLSEADADKVGTDASTSSSSGSTSSDEPILTKDKMTFMQKTIRSFEKTFIVDGRYRLFLQGLWVTIKITVIATLLGTALAFLQCMARRSKRAWLRYPAKVYIGIMQGTPILVVLLIAYYVVFTKLAIPGDVVAAIALALNFAAYAGEQMRSGVDGIDQGLLEAARALGFGRFHVFWKIIFPIATRRIMPVYKGEFISLLKTTSIVGYVAIQDLTKASDIVRGRTYEAFFPLIATAIIYLLTAHFLASGFAYLEYRLNPVNRRKRAKGEVNV